MTLENELSQTDRNLLDQLAKGIARRRMIAPAMFALESMKPLAFASSQVMVMLQPIVAALWVDSATYNRVTRLLERRGTLELLLRRLEGLA